MQSRKFLELAKKYGTPLYIYDEEVVERQCKKLATHFKGFEIHYAMKANSNPTLLKIIREQGIGVEAVSPGELAAALLAGWKPKNISYTSSSMTLEELTNAGRSGALVHLDSLAQLELWGKKKLGSTVSLRLNQGIGAGHHAHVITGGPDSKFGISLTDIPEAKRIAERYGITITGLQQHIGSNVLDVEIILRAAEKLLATARTFPHVTHIDFGGGLGVPYKPGQRELDVRTVGKRLGMLARAFEKEIGHAVTFAIEPGRYLVAEAGTLLATVVDMKQTKKHTFIGINTGFNQLVRPAMYDSYHEIENLRKGSARIAATVAGNVCESGDLFSRKRTLHAPRLGDTLAIRTSGAYGFSMASNYNLRKLPREVLLSKKGAKDISFKPADSAL